MYNLSKTIAGRSIGQQFPFGSIIYLCWRCWRCWHLSGKKYLAVNIIEYVKCKTDNGCNLICFLFQGDGGSPLVCPIGRLEDNRYAQNGIVAWGLGCKQSVPGVYVNVALVRDWIDSQIRLLGLDTSYYTFRN